MKEERFLYSWPKVEWTFWWATNEVFVSYTALACSLWMRS